MKITVIDERAHSGEHRITAKIELQDTHDQVDGVGVGETPGEAACIAIDEMVDDLAAMRLRYAPTPTISARSARQVVADFLELAREATALGMQPRVSLQGDAAHVELVRLGADTRVAEVDTFCWDAAEIGLDRHRNAKITADSDTRRKPAPADELEQASDEAMITGAANLETATLLYGDNLDGGPGGGDAAIGDKGRPF